MNKSDFTYLLKNPHNVSQKHLGQLTEIIQEFPYLQSARALQLKELNNLKSYKYNTALKTTAAYTVDRSILFQFITSNLFYKEVEIDKNDSITSKKSIESPEITMKEKTKEHNTDSIEELKINEELNIGKPLTFISSEPHSFNEWMQLISKKPINRVSATNTAENQTSRDSKLKLIDKFIEQNPKIKPVDKTAQTIDISLDSFQENEHLMTETLARVYIEQKKYDNAIKAYRILSLKYPEKSGFFANRIKAIKILQRNKS
jgi:hypothetical protein